MALFGLCRAGYAQRMLIGLHTLVCEVQDMDRAVAFYRDLLGLPVPFTSQAGPAFCWAAFGLAFTLPWVRLVAQAGGW